MEIPTSHIKFFLGFSLNGEIKMHLNQSTSWKEANLFKNQMLTESSFQEKNYIGILIPHPLNASQLKQKEEELKHLISSYCPKLQIDKHKIYLFPQLLLF